MLKSIQRIIAFKRVSFSALRYVPLKLKIMFFCVSLIAVHQSNLKINHLINEAAEKAGSFLLSHLILRRINRDEAEITKLQG